MKDFSLSNPYTVGGAFPNTAAKTADAGQTNGTAFNKALVDEIMGFFQAALVKGNRTPSGASDTSGSSQILSSIIDYARKPDQRKFKYTVYYFQGVTLLSHPTTEYKMSFFWDGETARYVFDETMALETPAGTDKAILVSTDDSILSTSGDRWSGLVNVYDGTNPAIVRDVQISAEVSTSHGISPAQIALVVKLPLVPMDSKTITFRNGFSFHPVPLSDWA